MTPPAERRSLLAVNPAFAFGSLLALYFLLGRWTFARLDGHYGEISLFAQPRVWAVLAILFLGGLIYRELRERHLCQPLTIDAAICFWLLLMLVSASWSPDVDLATEKAIEVAMLLTVALAIALSRSPATNATVFIGFWYTLVALGAAMGLLALAMSSGGRVFTPTGGPNIFGRNMGLAGVGALFLATRHHGLTRWACYAVVPMSAMWVVMCGSRGALLASMVAAMVLLITARMRISTKLFAVGAFSIAAMIVFFCTDAGRNALEVFQHRILHQTVEQRYTAARDDLFTEAWQVGWQRPVLGWGLAGFRANSWTYPHNIFLEAFTEGGLAAFLLLVGVLLLWWRHIRPIRSAIPGASLAALTLVLTSAQFSGNFYDSRGVFLLLALSVEPMLRSAPVSPAGEHPVLTRRQPLIDRRRRSLAH